MKNRPEEVQRHLGDMVNVGRAEIVAAERGREKWMDPLDKHINKTSKLRQPSFPIIPSLIYIVIHPPVKFVVLTFQSLQKAFFTSSSCT